MSDIYCGIVNCAWKREYQPLSSVTPLLRLLFLCGHTAAAWDKAKVRKVICLTRAAKLHFSCKDKICIVHGAFGKRFCVLKNPQVCNVALFYYGVASLWPVTLSLSLIFIWQHSHSHLFSTTILQCNSLQDGNNCKVKTNLQNITVASVLASF